MNIKDITSENYEQFKYVFWLDWSNKVKYIDLFKRGITSGDTLGLFFIKDAKAILELVRYYKDFKKIIIYDCDGPISLLKDYDSIDEFNDPRVEYVYVGQDLPMKFDKIIMNPPYNLGNKITEAVLSSLDDDGDCVCLQPLSQYKKKELYRHVETFELADPSLFEDAAITENLSICLLNTNTIDKYTWTDMTLASYDQRYTDYYKYNDLNYGKYLDFKFKIIGKTPKIGYKIVEGLGIKNQIFIHRRCTHGINKTKDNYFHMLNTGKISYLDIPFVGNVKAKDGSFTNYMWAMSSIILLSQKARDNCYDWINSSVIINNIMAGLHTDGTTKLCWPQIDWENISNNPLWKAGDYDDAVLNEMGLKWNADKTVIIKDE